MSEQATANQVAAGRWHLNAAQSLASFAVAHFGHSVDGAIPLRTAEAEIGPTGDIRRAHIELDVAAIATGNSRRDNDLAKHRFLDTAHHPTMMVDLQPAGNHEGGWRTTATLRVRGIALDLKVAVRLAEPVSDDVARVIVTGTLDRTPLGIKVPSLIIAKTIAIRVDAVFRRVNS